ncbi:NADH-ubiquinone oxidoreductase chain 4 [Trichinella sp. T8]|nr:NADH-ubiquinone oxidoreductase chain 4 [Trichinella sp. T8]
MELLSVYGIWVFVVGVGWGFWVGNQPERLMAANYLVIYTLMFSFPLLVLVIRFLVDCSVVGWASVVWVDGAVMVVMLLPFVIKLPVYLFHLWLPKAHVEAPVLGRMILASILLKTGGYGLVKVSGLSVGSDCVFGLVGLLLFLSLMSAITTVVQNDLKKFVAYSSVTHMTMVLGLVVMGSGVLDSAVVCLMLSHGVLSNSMFFMVGFLRLLGWLGRSHMWIVVMAIVWLVLVAGEFRVVTLHVMSFGVDLGFNFGGYWYNVTFSLVVLLLASWVLYYASSYMSSSVGFMRFNVLMLIFILRILVVVVVVTLGCGFVFDYEYVVYGSLRLAMFLGAMIAKRAQIPMRRWLPIAMAAPTPVSSLVHSSTLVVAGCVLCVKLGDCMGVMWVNGLLVVLGLLTRLYASLMAFFEFDLKKILAYSTISQIAMVMLMLLSGIYSLMMIHVMNHALVKALLFMDVGIMMRVILCLIVMCGLTFTSCYYSKEYSVCLSIKEDTLFHLMNVVLFISVMYSLRIVYVLMGGLSGKVMIVPVMVMGWFLIMNFSMPCNPCFDVFKAFLLVTPFVMILFVLKVWVFSGVMNVDLYYEYLGSKIVGLKVFVLGFVKGMHVSGVMSLVSLVGFNVRLKMESMGLKSLGFLRESSSVSWVNMWFLTVVHKVVPFIVSMLMVDSVLVGVVCIISILWSVFRWLWLASSDLGKFVVYYLMYVSVMFVVMRGISGKGCCDLVEVSCNCYEVVFCSFVVLVDFGGECCEVVSLFAGGLGWGRVGALFWIGLGLVLCTLVLIFAYKGCFGGVFMVSCANKSLATVGALPGVTELNMD